jgi:hypothetical protein
MMTRSELIEEAKSINELNISLGYGRLYSVSISSRTGDPYVEANDRYGTYMVKEGDASECALAMYKDALWLYSSRARAWKEMQDGGIAPKPERL